MDHSPRTTVRSNWLRFSWNQISGANKVILIMSFTLSLLQIIVTSIILGIGGSLQISCDKPLQQYLIVFVIRVGVSIPFTVYQHLSIPRRQQQQTPIQQTIIGQCTGSSSSNSNHEATSAPDTSRNENNVRSQQEQDNAILLNLWTDRIKSVLDLFAILWFIVGNYLIFSPSDCSYKAASYFYTTLTWVLFGYMILLVPILIFISVIFCLPCVLGTIVMAMRTFNINVSNIMVGGTKEEISKIPTFKFKTAAAPAETTNKPSRSFFNKLFSRHNKAGPGEYYDDLIISQSEDAVCSICLTEYEDNDLIAKLWCKHHFHKDCVHEWLGLNSTCPLCKRDFRGKQLSDNSSIEEQL